MTLTRKQMLRVTSLVLQQIRDDLTEEIRPDNVVDMCRDYVHWYEIQEAVQKRDRYVKVDVGWKDEIKEQWDWLFAPYE